MPIRPGKYDELCTYVHNQSRAQGTILVVLKGDRGDGFSCQVPLEVTFQLAELLEHIAREIRKTLAEPEELQLTQRPRRQH